MLYYYLVIMKRLVLVNANMLISACMSGVPIKVVVVLINTFLFLTNDYHDKISASAYILVYNYLLLFLNNRYN